MQIPENEQDQIAWLEALISDAAWQDNPLLPVVRYLHNKNLQQHKRMEKLLRIADGFDGLTNSQNKSLMDRYEKQLRRLTKIARISDLYQRTMVELNDNLRQAALHDPLTGLPNRRSIAERLKEEVARYRRSHKTFAVLMLDIDYFKSINDHYGHDAGDRVLLAAVEVVKPHLRDYDICCRWGGEEFLVFLPDTNLEQAQLIAERIRGAFHEVSLAKLDLIDAGQPDVNLSVSIGLTKFRTDEVYETTINRADAAMYDAKARGRDRVVVTE